MLPGRWPGRCGLVCVLLVASAPAGANAPNSTPELQQLLEQNHREIKRLEALALAAGRQVEALRHDLDQARARNRAQVDRIESLDEQLEARRAHAPELRRHWQDVVFDALAASLPSGPVARVEGDRLVIATDPVFVFGTGEIGAEGRDRLQPVARALVAALSRLPPELDWRLEVAGHTDRRPLRGDARFADNWGLSAARATAVLRLLHDQGVASPRLAAVAYGASEPLDPAINKAAHRRNRRVEIRLRFPEALTAAN